MPEEVTLEDLPEKPKDPRFDDLDEDPNAPQSYGVEAVDKRRRPKI